MAMTDPKASAAQQPLLYYSANTELAYRISEIYYGQIHYVWCTPFFTPSKGGELDYKVPSSSAPRDIYASFYKEVEQRDNHGTNIERNRVGLRNGVIAKKRAGVLTDQQADELNFLIDNATTSDFRPLLYVIPHEGVSHLVQLVPLRERANPFSLEYRIAELPRRCFDVIRIEWD